jgi:hypothetical protein
MPKFNETSSKGSLVFVEKKIMDAAKIKINDKFVAIPGNKQIILQLVEVEG